MREVPITYAMFLHSPPTFGFGGSDLCVFKKAFAETFHCYNKKAVQAIYDSYYETGVLPSWVSQWIDNNFLFVLFYKN